MRFLRVSIAGAVLMLAFACHTARDELWFDGDFQAAVAEAATDGKLIMVDFFDYGCIPCRRLDAETFSDRRVQDALRSMIALKIVSGEDAEASVQDEIAADDLHDIARFASTNGHYDVAADLFQRWYDKVGGSADTGDLNAAAWDLYKCRRSLSLAVEMAREAFAREDNPDWADTLAHLLYVTGEVDEAIRIQTVASSGASGGTAEMYAEVLERMRSGLELEDQPAFEIYPN